MQMGEIDVATGGAFVDYIRWLVGSALFQPWMKRRIPHAWRLFSTWRRLEIPARAPPLTQRIVRGLAAYEMILGNFEMSALLLLSFHCLLRTGELLALNPSDLLLGEDSGIVSLQSTKSGKRNAATEAISITDTVTLEAVRNLLACRKALTSGSSPCGMVHQQRFAEDLLSFAISLVWTICSSDLIRFGEEERLICFNKLNQWRQH